MAMETHVLFRGKLPSVAALGRAMKELGFPLSIPDATGSLEQQSGVIPMRLRREETGVEFQYWTDPGDVAVLRREGIDPSLDRAASFRWTGDENEMLAGLCAAAALARLTDGVVLEEMEDKLLSADQAIAMARETLKSVVREKRTREPGTRPADIKRYLKPILQQRSDLVLVDRYFLIRPVRHLMRGVLLDRTSDKHSFRIWRFTKPLFTGPEAGGLEFGDYLRGSGWQVWQPYFQGLLIDTLAEDIFAQVGKVTTLSEFAASLSDDPWLGGTELFHTGRVAAFVLGGEREQAAEYIRAMERKGGYWKRWAEAQWQFLDRDVAEICAEFHAKEAETAAAWKLTHIWEPAPFPVEVPAAECMSRSADPPFVATPWPARPPGLVEKPPHLPGEVRFAQDVLYRYDGMMMLVPLTPTEAEERHRDFKPYVLFTRLAADVLLLLQYWSGGGSRVVSLEGPSRWARAFFREDCDSGLFHLEFLRCGAAGGSKTWYWRHDRGDDCYRIHDYRNEEEVSRLPVPDADRELLTGPIPAFGELDDLVGRVRAMLQRAGYGEIT